MQLDIYTDGACSGNPGPGGWAYVMVQKQAIEEVIAAEESGGELNTTNNRMELLAVIAALKMLKNNTGVSGTAVLDGNTTIHTDSQYVKKGITEWIKNWKRNSWLTSDKKPVKNKDLWLELDALAEEKNLNWIWIKGHAGNIYNERCDKMAQQAIIDILQ